MQKFDIWQEGYNITGNTGTAELLCTGFEVSSLTSFREACALFFISNPNPNYTPRTNTVWGCKLFDNEADARKGFG